MRKWFWIGLLWLGCVKGMTQPTPYIVTDFHEGELDEAIEMCRKAEVGHLLHATPFSSYGHYEWKYFQKSKWSILKYVALKIIILRLRKINVLQD